jgi:malate dehydrogenase (oxaloacetate-decarboxylating)(NADP+)
VRRRAATAKVRALPPKRVEAVAIGSAAETETEEVVVEVAAAIEELPVVPWATSVAR